MIKKIIKPILLIIIVLSLMFIPKVNAYTKNPLDRIDLYEITINPRQDGTLDITFNIEWTVLDSNSQGPLEWVKIGIPNYDATEFKKLTNNISKIGYMVEFGSFIRIDLDRAYYEGETVKFSFSYHQSKMYFLTSDRCSYHYIPGYFSEIKVKEAIVKWNKENVVVHNAPKEDDKYLIWESSLNFNQKMEIRVEYNQNSFIGLSFEEQYTGAFLGPKQKFILVVAIVSIVVVISIIVAIYRSTRDPYLYDRGFIGRRYYRYHFFRYRRMRRYYGNGYFRSGALIAPPRPPSSSGSGYSGGGFSCACACACAGGGRAGCSKKDFYKTNLQSEKIIKHLKQK